jgi:hypothetical protein
VRAACPIAWSPPPAPPNVEQLLHGVQIRLEVPAASTFHHRLDSEKDFNRNGKSLLSYRKVLLQDEQRSPFRSVREKHPKYGEVEGRLHVLVVVSFCRQMDLASLSQALLLAQLTFPSPSHHNSSRHSPDPGADLRLMTMFSANCHLLRDAAMPI